MMKRDVAVFQLLAQARQLGHSSKSAAIWGIAAVALMHQITTFSIIGSSPATG
jgi:hypothetical protein